MIRPIDIRLNAAHPELPLAEAVTFTGSPSTVLIRGVPPNCGRWAITAVFVAASFPDGSTTTRAAVQSANGVWVATLPATATSGRTANGIRVTADGVDENGEAVTGYILGVADFAVASLAVTPAPEPGETTWALRYFDAPPTPAKKGDVAPTNGDLKVYNGTAWVGFSDASVGNLSNALSQLSVQLAGNYYTKAQTDEAIDKLAAYYITADAQGNPFATHAALVNAQTYYSGGSVRTPTRNDYAVVSADETHGGAEWRYIYAVDAQGVGQWEPQYAVEGVIAYDNTVTRASANSVKSSGIWSMIWGALSALPSGFSSLYDWCVAQLAGKLDGVVSVTHAELVAMRDAGQLKPGQQYRITDYVATTNGSSDSQSAGHPFDIIVTADDERTLNEHARAIMHDGELPDDIVDGTTRRKYFADNDLAAWDVWYCIDNDDERFVWADTTNGRGVIYRLVDEFDNDIPYDFKGLQMKPLIDPFGEGEEWQYDTQYRYTFDMGGIDASLNLSDSGANVARNRIGPNGDTMAEPRQLNRVIFLGGDTTSNTLAGDCSEITIKEGHDNEFGPNCRFIFLGSWSSSNVFAPRCAYIKLGEGCYANMFGADSADSSFGDGCQSNVLGPYSVAEFGSSCSANFVAGDSQGAVVLGADCRNNYVGGENGRIECGRACSSNTFGAGCGEIYVGEGVTSCSFGAGCYVIYFGDPEGPRQGYFSNITFEEGLHMIYLLCSVDHGDEVLCQNITVSKGVDGTAFGVPIRIEVDDAGQNYMTTYKPAGSKEISVEVE